MELWKRNFILTVALHVGTALFPFLSVSREKLTPDRVTLALAVLAVIFLLEILAMSACHFLPQDTST